MNNLTQTISETLSGFINPIFPNAKQRIRVWLDIHKFKVGEDEDIWKQSRGITQKEGEVYFDGEFVCSFTESQTPSEVMVVFLNSIKRLYKEGKIFVHEGVYRIRAEEARQKRLKQEQDEIAAIPTARNKEEEILREVIVKAKKNKKLLKK